MFDYSNTNTILLGKVIEQVTGQPVGDVFQERIMNPLGLTNTSFVLDSLAMPAPYAQGYTMQSGEEGTPAQPTNATHWSPSWTWTAGAAISNMNDLLTYGRAIGTGQGLLTPAMQAQRLTSFLPASSGYEYGLAMGCVDGWVGHNGELPGYTKTVYYDTTTDTTAIVQVNSDVNPESAPRPRRPPVTRPIRHATNRPRASPLR